MDPGSNKTALLRVILGLATEAHKIIMVAGVAATAEVAPASGVLPALDNDARQYWQYGC